VKGSKRNTARPVRVITRLQVVGVVAMIAVLGVAAYVLVRVLSGNDTAGQSTLVPDQKPASVPVIPVSEKYVNQGIAIDYAVRPDPAGADLTEINFTLTDGLTGQPAMLAEPPAVWVGFQHGLQAPPNKDALTCEDKIKLYASGSLDSRPEIDLNSYFILVLNDDPSISVIDPLNGVTGISQLYAMVLLKSPGEDWAMSRDGKRLFVTMPRVGQVAVVDTESFSVITNIDAGSNPVRIALQPDGKYLWVGNDSTNGAKSGVTVLDAEKLEVVARIKTGAGQHTFAFSGDLVGEHSHETGTGALNQTGDAFVANSQAGTISVIDTHSFEDHVDVPVGLHPTSLDFSSVSNTLYVAGADESTIVALDASSHKVVGRVGVAHGIGAIRFAPGGRWGFAVSPSSNKVEVIDASTNLVIHSVSVAGAPDKVSFTQGYAYVHASQKADVTLIDLTRLGQPDSLSPVTIIGGQTPPDQSKTLLSVAEAITPVHEHGNHVLIANPGDQSIYYYMEGMNAPMASFQNYSRTPRAVRVVDRTMRETAPGVYVANVRIPRSGDYQVAFLLDSPRIVHCFSFTTEPDSSAVGDNGKESLTIQFLNEEREIQAGTKFMLKFALAGANTQVPVADLSDVTLLATLASGQRSERFHADSTGNGQYEAQIILPATGVYNVYVTSPSRKIDVGDLPSLTLTVKP